MHPFPSSLDVPHPPRSLSTATRLCAWLPKYLLRMVLRSENIVADLSYHFLEGRRVGSGYNDMRRKSWPCG